MAHRRVLSGLRRALRRVTPAGKRAVRGMSDAGTTLGHATAVWLDFDEPAHPAPRRLASDDAHDRRDPFRGGPQPPFAR